MILFDRCPVCQHLVMRWHPEVGPSRGPYTFARHPNPDRLGRCPGSGQPIEHPTPAPTTPEA